VSKKEPPVKINVYADRKKMAEAAAEHAARLLRSAIDRSGRARFVVATGSSQLEFLDRLVESPGIDWSRTVMFHLDEYIGIGSDHPASFVGYLRDRLVDRVHPGEVHFLDGLAPDADREGERVGSLISAAPIDVAFVGIGENGHLAFNDPPADFETDAPYLVVDLDRACRMQQVGEGWFSSFDEVPRQALSMSIRQIMSAGEIICTVPDRRKAEAVRDCLGPDAGVSPDHPASILQNHDSCHVFLDEEAASLL
jgi:glucosamine-6-phosphate deaminase